MRAGRGQAEEAIKRPPLGTWQGEPPAAEAEAEAEAEPVLECLLGEGQNREPVGCVRSTGFDPRIFAGLFHGRVRRDATGGSFLELKAEATGGARAHAHRHHRKEACGNC